MQGAHMAIKIPLSPVSCKYTTEQLLDDKYYLPYNRILASVKRGFFRMRTTPKYYKFSAYAGICRHLKQSCSKLCQISCSRGNAPF
ncbi:hypothetical protein CRE_15621 [Caenorhabditis remanei]|uniref:Uncharacterized protein n=1 Tax=Caenorhabditis remanei TaxID=31234 RepID=E3N2Q0_CAERE|nr:hypothetical protein CRE_15621 [Caenorhabditis remanei]